MEPLIALIDLFINLYFFVLLARVLLPVFGINPYHPVMQVIIRLTEPILAPIRSILPRVGMMDFSPMVAMILLTVLQFVLTAFLRG